MEYFKSCLNYTGGKYKLLNQLLPLFPSKINTFVDLFCGGATVALNVNSNKTVCNDSNSDLIYLFNYFKKTDLIYLFQSLNKIINEYDLSESDKYGYDYYNCNSNNGLSSFNRNKYLKLREDFNSNRLLEFDRCLYFYTLIVFGFNNQIRFNKKHEFNNPVGKRDFNSRTQKNLVNFHKIINKKNITFLNKDFVNFDISDLSFNDFVYCDPPYLITIAPYNEQNAWNISHEKNLMLFLDKLNENNINFALSNIFECKGKENKILKEWANQYNINFLDFDYNNANYQRGNDASVEVLICNY